MFKSFVLTEDRKLTLEAQQYLIDELDDELDFDVQAALVPNALVITTNVGFKKTLTLVGPEPSGKIADVKGLWVGEHGKSVPLIEIVKHVNSCVAMLKHCDVCIVKGLPKEALFSYHVIDNKGKVNLAVSMIPHDKELADYLFKLFPKQTFDILIAANIYDREKGLEAYSTKRISDVVKVYDDGGLNDDSNNSASDKLSKLIAAITDKALKTNDEKDIKDIVKNLDVAKLKPKLSRTVGNKLELAIKKASRTAQERDQDKHSDQFIFVGYEKFEPVPGTSHHKRRLEIENFYKANRFDLEDHQAIQQMLMRARIHNGHVYTISLPKGYIKEKTSSPSQMPEWLIDLIDERKTKLA